MAERDIDMLLQNVEFGKIPQEVANDAVLNVDRQGVKDYIDKLKKKSTLYCAKRDLKLLYKYLVQKNELRSFETMPTSELDAYLSEFYVTKEMSSLSDDYLFVMAIDFGTTYSGYAYSSRADFKNDPLKISANQAWNAGTQRHISLKTPTCLLLKQNKEFESFGYEAENKYNNIVLKKRQNEFYYFQKFKMHLYKSENVKSDMVIEDVTGKPLKAMIVFSESIKALTKHFFRIVNGTGVNVKDTDIRYVLTVPAIWSDAAKQFMRKSANMAGIEDTQLVLALEPEAASVYSQFLPMKGISTGFNMSEAGLQYVVVDNGGGTCDITIHEKLRDGSLKELSCASGTDCGGTSVDQAFYQIFVKLIGAPLLTTMKVEEPSVYLDLFREFEAVKRTIDSNNDDVIPMTIPRAALDEMCNDHLYEDFTHVIQNSTLKDKLKVRLDKILIDAEMLKKLLNDVSQKIVEQVKIALKEKNIKIIVLVGGFSECKIVQDDIRKNFPQCTVIVPIEPGLSVLKGAVLFGHRPDFIISRIARYTYGIGTDMAFDRRKHDPERLISYYGKEYCEGCFDIYVKKGAEVKLGTTIIKYSATAEEYQSAVGIPVYRSTSECPVYINDPGCHLIGQLKISISNPTKEARKFRESFIFGYTELKITVADVESGEDCETVYEFI